MKKSDLIKHLEELPDYDVCLSGYIKIDKEALDNMDDGEEADEDVMMVIDYPILGLASNDETKEIRFVVEGTNLEALEAIDGEMTELQEDDNDTNPDTDD
jgi:hypothetical protein